MFHSQVDTPTILSLTELLYTYVPNQTATRLNMEKR